jgi:hypothetical protein
MKGVLAYGSLIKDAGELEPFVIERRKTRTPFKVEFARKSGSRANAPTLVPVRKGGAHVNAEILILEDKVGLQETFDMLYRRELHKTKNSGLKYRPMVDKNAVRINTLRNFRGVKTVIYTRISPNIKHRNPKLLAKLAVASAKIKGLEKLDGISYLMDVKQFGMKTPMMRKYEQEILRLTQTSDLEHAWRAATNQIN